MNLEGIQTIRIMKTVFGVLLNFGVKKTSQLILVAIFPESQPQNLQKSLQILRQSLSLAVLMSYIMIQKSAQTYFNIQSSHNFNSQYFRELLDFCFKMTMESYEGPGI